MNLTNHVWITGGPFSLRGKMHPELETFAATRLPLCIQCQAPSRRSIDVRGRAGFEKGMHVVINGAVRDVASNAFRTTSEGFGAVEQG